MSLIQKISKKEAWADCQWEFYKNIDGNWVWRASAPESWCKEHGVPLPTARTVPDATWTQNNTENQRWASETWYEVAHSSNWYASKTDCENNAREWGWKQAW